MADLAEQVAKRSNDTFTQNFVDRQTALSASNESDVVSLQQSWSLLSKEERVSITERDRQQFDEITAQIRVNESPVGAWVRAQKLTNMPFTNIANSVRNAMAGMKHADEAIEYKNAYGSYSDDFAALRQDAVDNGKTIYDLAAYRDVQKKQEAVSQMADKLLKDSYDYAPALKAKADYTMSDLRSHQQGFMRESQMYAGHKNGASE
ncbi:MAG: hypothetical protein GY862_12685, partial [Gammaproteobacteria bacterium]|nr:hypothetical protein [Gammaproteobacteria bacterium]